MAEIWLAEIADRVDVARSLLYHYFPRGRADVAKAVVDRACDELMAEWLADEHLPMLDWMNAKTARFLDHAVPRSEVWRVYRMARSTAEPEITERIKDHVEAVVSVLALKRTGSSRPSPSMRLALVAFIAFAEAVLDGVEQIEAPPEQLGRLLTETLATVVRVAG